MENYLVWNEYISFATSGKSAKSGSKSGKSSSAQRSNAKKKSGNSGGSGSKKKSKKNKEKQVSNTLGGALIFVSLIVVILLLLDYTGGKLVKTQTAFDSMTQDELNAFMQPYINSYIDKKTIKLTVDGKVYSLQLSDYDFEFSPGTCGKIDYIYKDGKRCAYTTTGVLRYNRTALGEFVEGIVGSDAVTMTEPEYVVDYEKETLTIYPGTAGLGVDIDKIVGEIEQSMCLPTPNATAGIVELPAPEINIEAIYGSIATEATDAYTTEDASGNTVYHDEIIGVDFDINEAKSALKEQQDMYVIKIEVTKPEITVKRLRAYTFPDLLASYYTYYNTNKVNRSSNLALAAQYINGLVLEPGEQFSFNGTVGKRTAERGFKIAGVYTSEGSGESYGGGICQTSSTLYYACILSNLQIDERKNHMYTVSYMRDHITGKQVFGCDATVSWGTTDFKFTNNKEYPIKIEMYAKNGVLYCNIYGTEDGYTAAFAYDVVRITDYKVKYLPVDGSSNQSGQSGRVVRTYRIVYKDGVEIERKLESKNTYSPMNKIVYTNDLPQGLEYGVLYAQGYKPPNDETAGETETGDVDEGGEDNTATE